MVDKTVRMNLLFDFYGQLLTDRQRRFFEMYYAEDLSLGEIAETSGVSRQAVYDIIKRSAASLESFEERLGLAARHGRQQERLHRLEHRVFQLLEAAGERDDLGPTARDWLRAQAEQMLELVRSIGASEE